MVVTRSKTGNLPIQAHGSHLEDDEDEFDTNFNGFNTSNVTNRRQRRHMDDKKLLPQYKVDQIEKLQRLTKMSNSAKPRSMVGEYGAFEGESKLMISKDSKSKISLATGYNPVRISILSGDISEEERKCLEESFKKQSKLAKVKVKDLSSDKYLKHTLSLMKSRNLKLKRWHTCDIDYNGIETSTSPLVLNEMGLNLLSLDSDIQTILKMNSSHYKEVSFKTNFKDLDPRLDMSLPTRIPNHGKLNEKVTSIESIGKDSTMFNQIDIERVKHETELENILSNRVLYQTSGDDIYKGLKREDFTTIKQFNGI